MEHIRREKKIFNTKASEKIPLLSVRYSKDLMDSKTSVKFMHPTRAEIYVHLQGDGVFFVGDHMLRMNCGDILIYNKDEVHFSTIEQNTVWERFVLFFLPEYFSFFDDMASHLLNFFFERKNYQSNLIKLPDAKRKQLLDLLFEIDRHQSDSDFESNLQMFQSFLRILQLVNDGYLHPSGFNQAVKTPYLINEIINYINENFPKDITLDTIAEHINISKSYLSALFKKHVGVSPYEYLLSVRLDKAKQLLSYGENIADACYASGFGDYSHFIQFFKKRVGITPYQYRKKYCNEYRKG